MMQQYLARVFISRKRKTDRVMISWWRKFGVVCFFYYYYFFFFGNSVTIKNGEKKIKQRVVCLPLTVDGCFPYLSILVAVAEGRRLSTDWNELIRSFRGNHRKMFISSPPHFLFNNRLFSFFIWNIDLFPPFFPTSTHPHSHTPSYVKTPALLKRRRRKQKIDKKEEEEKIL